MSGRRLPLIDGSFDLVVVQTAAACEALFAEAGAPERLDRCRRRR
jgi:hypothetical protein